MNYYSNMNLWDSSGRRVAIFWNPFKDGSGAHILVFTCSKKDHFCRKTARQAYINWEELGIPHLFKGGGSSGEILYTLHPRSEITHLNSRKDFNLWCRQNYFKKKNITIAVPARVRKILNVKPCRGNWMINKGMKNYIATTVLIKDDEVRQTKGGQTNPPGEEGTPGGQHLL